MDLLHHHLKKLRLINEKFLLCKKNQRYIIGDLFTIDTTYFALILD